MSKDDARLPGDEDERKNDDDHPKDEGGDQADRIGVPVNTEMIDKQRPPEEDGLSDYEANYPDGFPPSSGRKR